MKALTENIQRYEAAKDEEFTLQEFLSICRQDRSAYANAAERLLMAIGEPVMVDTALESRMSRLFSNRVIASPNRIGSRTTRQK